MGICPCEGTKNIIILGEIPVPEDNNQALSSNNINDILSSHPDQKQMTKKVICFSKLNNSIKSQSVSYCLSSLINDIASQANQSNTLMVKSPEINKRQSIKGRGELLRKLTEKEGSAISKKSSRHPNQASHVSQHNNNNPTSDQDDPHNSLLKYKDIEYSVMMKVVSPEEEEMMIESLKHHFLFWSYHDKMIKSFIDAMVIIKIEENSFICKDKEICSGMYMIKSGIVELKTKEKSRQLNQGAFFGELGLMNHLKGKDFTKEYSTYSKDNIELYYLSKASFHKVLSDYDKAIEEEFDDSNHQTINMNFIDNQCFLKSLPSKYKESIASLLRPFTFNTNNIIISTKSQAKPIFNRSNTLMHITSGEVTEIFHPTSSTDEMRNQVCLNETAGILHTMFKPHDKTHYEIIASSPGNCLVITENALIESIGPNYRYEILCSFFSAIILKCDLIKELMNKESPEQLFQGFSIKEYKSNEIVFNHCNYDNKKLCIVLNGELLNSKNAKIKLTKGVLHGDKMINSNSDLNYDLIAKNDNTFTLEASWKEIKDILKEYKDNASLFEGYNYLSKVDLLRNVSESELFNLAKALKKEKYKKSDVIIKEGNNNDKFYLLVKGRIKVKEGKTAKTVRIFDEGNCFGELSILNEDYINAYNYIANENTICYTMSTEMFYKLLKDLNLVEYIKRKMCMEDADIDIHDLFYINYLGQGKFGNVCLVHNTQCLYAAKAISKLAAEKQKSGVKNLLNEKKSMFSLDNPFVVKCVKTLKKDNWCFFLEEYISGLNFGKYLENRKMKKSLYETKFYGANLLFMVSYLNKRMIVHRDIKPSNIMLDSNGYLKMIDFGTAKKLKNSSKTIIGTPNFIAPEILKGEGYSFPVDYWSIGICLYYIYFGTLPFGQTVLDVKDIYQEIICAEPEFPKETPYEIQSLISGLLRKKPSQRVHTFEAVKEQVIYQDFCWDDMMKFRLKPFCLPPNDKWDNSDVLLMKDALFIRFMEAEKFTTVQMQTLKIPNTKEMIRSNSTINIQWFDEF